MRAKIPQAYYKIAVYGAPGRDALAKRFATGEYSDNHFTYVDTQQTSIVPFPDGTKFGFRKASNDRFRSISSDNEGIHRGTHAYIIAFDSTNPKAKSQITEEMKEITRIKQSSNAPIILVGTMADKGESAISSQEMEEFSKELAETYRREVSYFGNTSAKTNTNITEFFNYILDKIRPTPKPIQDYKSALKKVVYDFDTEEGCEKAFHETHARMMSEESFQCFRSTTIEGSENLSDILKHAADGNNRSRKVCIELGWLNKDGLLAEGAPDLIRENHPTNIKKPYGTF